jgi:hypothetical protein
MKALLAIASLAATLVGPVPTGASDPGVVIQIESSDSTTAGTILVKANGIRFRGQAAAMRMSDAGDFLEITAPARLEVMSGTGDIELKTAEGSSSFVVQTEWTASTGRQTAAIRGHAIRFRYATGQPPTLVDETGRGYQAAE